jgi:hypothetical protein
MHSMYIKTEVTSWDHSFHSQDTKLHTNKICAKLKSACYILGILKPNLTVNNLKVIYFSYIRSIITYVIIFWGNATGSDEVFKLQKRPLEWLQTHNAVPHVVTYLKNSSF